MQTSISVVIPTHNRPESLQRALKSVFNQTILPGEIVVIDDGSNPPVDESVFYECPKQIEWTLLRNVTAKGANNARNKGIESVSGEWIAFLDDDDEFETNKIEEIKKILSTQLNVDIIYHSATIYMVNEGVSYKSGTTIPQSENIYKDLLIKNIVGGTSVATIKKKSLRDVGGFDEKLPALQDYDLWLRLAKANKYFQFIDKPLLKYHHETKTNSISKSLINNKIAIDEIEEKHHNDFKKLSRNHFKKHEMWKQKMRVHKSLMNRQYKGAVQEQLTFFQKFPSIKSFLALLVIIAGPKVSFKLKSIVG